MDKPRGESWNQQENSIQKELKDEIVVSNDEVAPEAYVSNTDIKSYISTSDPEILKEMEDLQLSRYAPFNANGSINPAGVTGLVDIAICKRFGPALPDASNLATVRDAIVHELPREGQDSSTIFRNLLAIPQAVSSAKLSNHYYGFVSGGILPIAEAANSLVGAMDLNVMVHDPNTSIAVDIEAATLQMLLQVLDLPEEQWQGRTLTSGATGSNILALSAARDTLINRLLAIEYEGQQLTVAAEGLLSACDMVGVKALKILSQKGHSSVYKAAGVLGLGRGSVVECGLQDEPWRWDWKKVEAELADNSSVCIAVVSCGEVDTGRYGSFGDDIKSDMLRLRSLMDLTRSGGWIHVDGAFGIFARALPDNPEFSVQKSGVGGLEYADSIGADAHKCLNVPYESAFLFTHHAQSLIDICSNGSAAYLATAPVAGIVSPLNTSLENSRRFRALPIYGVLLTLGRRGLGKLFASQILLAREIAQRIHGDYASAFELLPLKKDGESWIEQLEQIGIIVLFRAKDEELNKHLTERINARNSIFVSGTSYGWRKAVRIAVAGWDIDYSKDGGDTAVVCGVLDQVLRDWEVEKQEKLKYNCETTITDDETTAVEGGSRDESGSETVSFPVFNLNSFTTQPTTLNEVQNSPPHTISQAKRPSIVYVSTSPLASVISVPKSEAEAMRRAFDLGVPSFLESDVGLDGGLEPRFSTASAPDYTTVMGPSRSERDRERARMLSPRSVHSPLAVHAARSPLAPYSPLLELERDGDRELAEVVWRKSEEKVESGEQQVVALAENQKAPYKPTRGEDAGSLAGSPRVDPSPHVDHASLSTMDVLD